MSKRSAPLDADETKAKRAKLSKDIASFEKDIESLSLVAEAKKCFITLSKANALRKAVNDKKRVIKIVIHFISRFEIFQT